MRFTISACSGSMIRLPSASFLLPAYERCFQLVALQESTLHFPLLTLAFYEAVQIFCLFHRIVMQGSDLAHMKTDWYLYCPHLCLLVISSELCGSAFTFFLCFLVGFLINDGRVETVAKIMDGFHQSLRCSVIGWYPSFSSCL